VTEFRLKLTLFLRSKVTDGQFV